MKTYHVYYPPLNVPGACITVRTGQGSGHALEQARKRWWKNFQAPDVALVKTEDAPVTYSVSNPLSEELRWAPGGIGALFYDLSMRSWTSATNIRQALFKHDNPEALKIDIGGPQNPWGVPLGVFGEADGQVAISEDPQTGEIVYARV